ncbi:hypothetical protein [Cohnella sp. GbtcB17]|uniref:hypothetical protein n=1 Tax=Cohnella sp. GbtcB17 TaxID=2824762 RepID=UPI001C2F7CF3|nr:hypothetical protein [Cohnella sp. GbtcB17]
MAQPYPKTRQLAWNKTEKKPKRINHNRGSRTAKQRGDISPKVAAKVDKRSKNRCEQCGWRPGNYDPTGARMGLQRAHLIRRGKVEDHTTAQDVAKLCGPSVNTGTCHWWIDHTREGMEWAKRYRKALQEGAGTNAPDD